MPKPETHQALIDFVSALTLRGKMTKFEATLIIAEAFRGYTKKGEDYDQAMIAKLTKEFLDG